VLVSLFIWWLPKLRRGLYSPRVDLFNRLAVTATALIALISGDVSNTAKPPAAILSFGRIPQQATILFGGDMMFDRTVRTAIDRLGADQIFSCIDSTLADSDAVVANLEGPITDHISVSVGSIVGAPNNFVFTFPDSTAQLLAHNHIAFVNLGNNHIANFGFTGVQNTIDALAAEHIAYFGDPISRTVATTSINDLPIAFINYNEFFEAPGGSASTTVYQIREYKSLGYLPIVYTHWGIEYATSSPEYVHELAHEFVDAGAVAVIGSHPHVIEESELYNNAPIYYSLGNFVFDQYWNGEVTHGLLVKLTLDRSGVKEIKEIPITIGTDSSVCPSE
jgi:poly-gamma-glutamate capsule biosynthesis protein CapA/YwtB (metallophosphatase superfamily)